MQPKVVGITSHASEPSVSVAERNGAISREMYNAILLEILEETGIPLEALVCPPRPRPPSFGCGLLSSDRSLCCARACLESYVSACLKKHFLSTEYAGETRRNLDSSFPYCVANLVRPFLPSLHASEYPLPDPIMICPYNNHWVVLSGFILLFLVFYPPSVFCFLTC